MEVKKNLNNIQRKMLDQIYTEQFDKRSKAILQDREKGLAELQTKLIKQTLKNKDVKKMIEAGVAFYRLRNELSSTLAESGISVEGYLSREPYLTIHGGYRTTNEFPEITEYKAKTREIELNLSEKKKEMRAKIYGVAASYEEVDSEIKELLKDI